MRRAPADLRTRPLLALARAAEQVPSPAALPGGVVRTNRRGTGFVSRWSGMDPPPAPGRETAGTSRPCSPTLSVPAVHQVPDGFVLDGEAVVWEDGSTSFGALQQRTTTRGPGLAALVRSRPASYVCFDLLAVAGHDVRARPLVERRSLLEALAASWTPPMTLAPVTTDVAQAEAWFNDLTGAGLEGLVVKGLSMGYAGGKREWVKVKHRSTVEVFCAAVIGPSPPTAVPGGRPTGGRRSTDRGENRVAQRHHLRTDRCAPARVRPGAARASPWPDQVPPSWFDRYTPNKQPVLLAHVDPIVLEVGADTARGPGGMFRHQLRYLRRGPTLTGKSF